MFAQPRCAWAAKVIDFPKLCKPALSRPSDTILSIVTCTGGASLAAMVHDEPGKALAAGPSQQQGPAGTQEAAGGGKHMQAPSISMPVMRGATEGNVRPC